MLNYCSSVNVPCIFKDFVREKANMLRANCVINRVRTG